MENKEIQDLHDLSEYIRKWVDGRKNQKELGFYPDKVPKIFDNHPCKDHQRFYKGRSQPMIYESHPYSVSMKDIKDLIDWCEENGLEFSIDGYSPWFPMNTIRISLYKKGKGPTYVEEMECLCQKD